MQTLSKVITMQMKVKQIDQSLTKLVMVQDTFKTHYKVGMKKLVWLSLEKKPLQDQSLEILS